MTKGLTSLFLTAPANKWCICFFLFIQHGKRCLENTNIFETENSICSKYIFVIGSSVTTVTTELWGQPHKYLAVPSLLYNTSRDKAKFLLVTSLVLWNCWIFKNINKTLAFHWLAHQAKSCFKLRCPSVFRVCVFATCCVFLNVLLLPFSKVKS